MKVLTLENLGSDFELDLDNKVVYSNIFIVGSIEPTAAPVTPKKKWLYFNTLLNAITHIWRTTEWVSINTDSRVKVGNNLVIETRTYSKELPEVGSDNVFEVILSNFARPLPQIGSRAGYLQAKLTGTIFRGSFSDFTVSVASIELTILCVVSADNIYSDSERTTAYFLKKNVDDSLTNISNVDGYFIFNNSNSQLKLIVLLEGSERQGPLYFNGKLELTTFFENNGTTIID